MQKEIHFILILSPAENQDCWQCAAMFWTSNQVKISLKASWYLKSLTYLKLILKKLLASTLFLLSFFIVNVLYIRFVMPARFDISYCHLWAFSMSWYSCSSSLLIHCPLSMNSQSLTNREPGLLTMCCNVLNFQQSKDFSQSWLISEECKNLNHSLTHVFYHRQVI